MSILGINIRRLRNAVHLQLIAAIIMLLEGASEVVKALLGDAVGKLKGAYEVEKAAADKVRASALTPAIIDADKRRDSLLDTIKLQLESFSHSDEAAEKAAYDELRPVIEHYGNFKHDPMREQTAKTRSYIRDMKAHAAALTTLNLTGRFDKLNEANETVDALMAQRFDEAAGQASRNMRDARRAVDAIYQPIIDTLNAHIALHSDADLTDLVNRMNERISYYKRTVGTEAPAEDEPKAAEGEAEAKA